MELKLLSGAQGSQSCPPTDPRREVENLGEHEGQPVTLWGLEGGNEESREKQRPERSKNGKTWVSNTWHPGCKLPWLWEKSQSRPRMIKPRHEKRRKGLRFKAEGRSCPAPSSSGHGRGAVQQDQVCLHTQQANGINPRHRLLALQICKNKTFVLYFNLLLEEPAGEGASPPRTTQWWSYLFRNKTKQGIF